MKAKDCTDRPIGRPKGSTSISRLAQHDDQIRRMARLGYTLKETAEAIGCWQGTLANYRTRNNITFKDGRGSGMGKRLQNPDIKARQLANMRRGLGRGEDYQPSPKWESTRKRKRLARKVFKMVRMDTWMEMTAASLMREVAKRDSYTFYRLGRGQHMTSFDLLI